MSSFGVYVERLTVLPHPNADALELAQVGLYRAVVTKGAYRTGDWAVYIPEAAVLPDDLIAELGLTGRLAGPDKNRVKAIRLRGELSQGIVCRPQELDWLWRRDDLDGHASNLSDIRSDFSPDLRITKWVPPVPVGMAGVMDSAPDLLPWCDIENIKRYPDLFQDGEQVVATEKVHGSCLLFTLDVETDAAYVSSKGVGARGLSLRHDTKNLYWRAVEQFGLWDVARGLAQRLDASRIGLFGEVYGRGVQDLHYGANAGQDDTLGFALFDVSIDGPDGVRFMDAAWLTMAAEHGWLPVPRVPEVYVGPYDYDLLAGLAEGTEAVSGTAAHLREGLVVRSAVEARHLTHGRKIAKFISGGYLTRGGDATEYE